MVNEAKLQNCPPTGTINHKFKTGSLTTKNQDAKPGGFAFRTIDVNAKMNGMVKTNPNFYPKVTKRYTPKDFKALDEVANTNQSLTVSRNHSPLDNRRDTGDNAKSELNNKNVHLPAMKQ